MIDGASILEVLRRTPAIWRAFAGRSGTTVPVSERLLEPPRGKRLRQDDIRLGRALSYLRRFTSKHPTSWLPRPSADMSPYVADMTHVAASTRFIESLARLPLPSAELEHLEKYVVQNGGAPYWSITPDGFYQADDSAVDMSLIEQGFQFLKKLAEHSDTPPGTRLPASKGFPTTTNGGAPHYLKGHRALLADVLRAGADYGIGGHDEQYRSYEEYAHVWGSDLPPHATMSNRSKPTSKAVEIYAPSDSGPLHMGSTYKIQDLRPVYMGVRYQNLQHGVAVSSLGAMLKYWYPTHHTTPESTAWKISMLLKKYRRGGSATHIKSHDLKRFDMCFREPIQIALRNFYGPYLTAYEMAMIDVIRDSPIMGGPLFLGDDGYLYDKRGKLASGTLFTSKDGTCVNIAREAGSMIYAMRWTVDQAFKAFLNREWGFLIWGDDTMTAFPEGCDEDRFIEATVRMGFEATEDSEPIFLMKRFYDREDGSIGWHPLVSRVLQQTFSPENPRGDFDDPDVRPVVLLGLYSRTINAEYSPLWQYAADKLVGRQSPLWNRGLERLRQYVTSPPFQAELARSLAARELNAELSAREDRADDPASSILEGAGVTYTGRSRSQMLDWIASDKSDALRARLRELAKRIAESYVPQIDDTEEPQITGRSASQMRTDALRSRKDAVTYVKQMLERDPELQQLTTDLGE